MNPLAGLVVRLICYFSVDPEISKEKVKEPIASSRFSSNVNGHSLSVLDRISEILINAHKKNSLFFEQSIKLSLVWRKIIKDLEKNLKKLTKVQVESKNFLPVNQRANTLFKNRRG